jgi:hypothetical protein
MITVKQLYDATIAGKGSLYRHALEHPEMPVFVLLGQDQHAADLVEKWAIWASVSDVSVKSGKVGEARLIAELMRNWPIHKAPD